MQKLLGPYLTFAESQRMQIVVIKPGASDPGFPMTYATLRDSNDTRERVVPLIIGNIDEPLLYVYTKNNDAFTETNHYISANSDYEYRSRYNNNTDNFYLLELV